MSPSPTLVQRNPSWLNWLFALFMALMLAATLAPGKAQAAPAAGTSIGNQAAATYTDLSLTTRSVTSNTVSTTVQHVATFTLTADQTKQGTPGGTVYFPHNLSNTGNGTNTFNLTITDNGGGFALTGIAIYADANGDGVPDNAVNLAGSNTGAVTAGGVFRFVAAATVPGAAGNGLLDSFLVTATPTVVGTTPASAFNTDTVQVTSNAAISVTKSISRSSGTSPDAGPIIYTLTYTNTGNQTATALLLTDVIPAGMTYLSNSGRWSVTGATVLTDSDVVAQGAGPTIIYDVGVTVGNRVTATISTVAPGETRTLTFNVSVDGGVLPGVPISNVAKYTYSDGGSPATSYGPLDTNAVSFTVNQTASLTFVGPAVATASAAQGATVTFTNVLTNTGSFTDSFDIALSPGNFPAGTTFTLYKSDGVTPLVDTNGNGIPDTGPVGAGLTYNVILQATLAANASGTGPFSITKTATSKFDPTQIAVATDQLTAVAVSRVDLTNNSAVGAGATQPLGLGIYPSIATAIAAVTGSNGPSVTTLTNPGTTVRFNLYVNNLLQAPAGPATDNYNLAATLSGPSAGWTVVFRSSVGAQPVITNTGPIAAGANLLVYADVTIPANFAPGTVNVDLSVISPLSGAADYKQDAVTVNTVNNVTLTPNNTGQVFPGGSIVYSHTLTNNGNVAQAITFPGTFLADNQAGWTSVLYLDNGTTPGVVDASDTVVVNATTIPIGTFVPGATQQLLVKVFASAAAAIGTIDTTTITATWTNAASTTGTVVATDSTTVIGGQVALVKLQALDFDCNGTIEGSFASTPLSAKPGECIRYQVTATNVGTADVTNLVVADSTPANTKYQNAFPATAVGAGAAIAGGAPANNFVGTIQTTTVLTLIPGGTVVLTFDVKIDP